MDLPLIGTVDLTPSGVFLAFAALLAVGYVVWRVVEARREVVRARDAEGDAPVEDGAPVEGGAAVKDGANEPGDDDSRIV